MDVHPAIYYWWKGTIIFVESFTHKEVCGTADLDLPYILLPEKFGSSSICALTLAIKASALLRSELLIMRCLSSQKIKLHSYGFSIIILEIFWG